MTIIWYTIRSIVALVGVIWLINFILNYLNNYTNKQHQMIKIIDRVSMSKSSSIAIVKILEEYYVMSVHENSTEVLEKISVTERKKLEKQLLELEKQKENKKGIQIEFQEKWLLLNEKIKKKKE